MARRRASIATKDRPVIGFFTHNLIGDYLEQQWVTLHEYAQTRDVTLQVFSPFLFYAQKVHREEFLRTFQLAGPNNLDGLIVSGSSLNVFFSREQIDQLYQASESIPVVTLAAEYGDTMSVVADNRRGFYRLTEHLIVTHGLSELAFLSGTVGNFDAQARQDAFTACLIDHGLTVDPDLMLAGDFGRASGRQAVEDLWDRRGRAPQALVCSNDDMALGALEELLRRGIRVPQDVVVVGFDNSAEGAAMNPSLTTVDQRSDAQVCAALDLVLARLDGRPTPTVNPVETTLVTRQSCGCDSTAGLDPGVGRRPDFTASQKGYNIGHLTNFTKNVGEALSLEVLADEIQKLCEHLQIPSLFIGTYLHGDPVDANHDLKSCEGQVFVDVLDGRVGTRGRAYAVEHLVVQPQVFRERRRTSVVSELVFQDEHYGYCVVEAFPTDPLLYQLINLEISNCFRHIFAKKRMDEALHRLEELDRMKNEFIANITHDFRSPLTVTMGMSELGMKETGPKTEDHRRHQAVFEASLKLKSTIDRFLELTRMDHQGLKVDLEPIDPHSFLKELASFYQSSMLNSAIKVTVERQRDVVDDFYSDQVKLEQILNNLISNALKFVDPLQGKVELLWDADDRNVRFVVKDNGQGIPAEALERIFERFTQLAPDRNHRFRGTGIGLAFSRQLAGYLKGTLEAQSDGPGKGASFLLTLPRGRPAFAGSDFRHDAALVPERDSHRGEVRSLLQMQIQERDAEATEVEIGSVNGESEFQMAKAVILIIEDNHHIRQLERDCLRVEGFRNFVLAADGKKGLDAVRQYRPDLILCDLNMPGMRGDELFDVLAGDHEFKRVPVLFVSAVSDNEFVRGLKQRGVEVFLSKPIDTIELVTAVRQQLKSTFERRRLERESQLDELTGLLNRRALTRQMEIEFLRRRNRDVCLIFADIDHFKRVNDTRGHQAGDQVLSAVGRALKTVLRPDDLCGRWGGEEVLILLPDTPLDAGRQVAEKLRRRVQGLALQADGRPLRVTASFGVASLRDHGEWLLPAGVPSLAGLFEPQTTEGVDWPERDRIVRGILDRLIELADRALYTAKERGRNRVEVVEGEPRPKV